MGDLTDRVGSAYSKACEYIVEHSTYKSEVGEKTKWEKLYKNPGRWLDISSIVYGLVIGEFVLPEIQVGFGHAVFVGPSAIRAAHEFHAKVRRLRHESGEWPKIPFNAEFESWYDGVKTWTDYVKKTSNMVVLQPLIFGTVGYGLTLTEITLAASFTI